jgi:hypothetical protein
MELWVEVTYAVGSGCGGCRGGVEQVARLHTPVEVMANGVVEEGRPADRKFLQRSCTSDPTGSNKMPQRFPQVFSA